MYGLVKSFIHIITNSLRTWGPTNDVDDILFEDGKSSHIKLQRHSKTTYSVIVSVGNYI